MIPDYFHLAESLCSDIILSENDRFCKYKYKYKYGRYM